jgi:hypothetical protein
MAGWPAACLPVYLLADCLAATLREYQLEGLRWLVGMWDRGVNAILADEMVRRLLAARLALLGLLDALRAGSVLSFDATPRWLACLL